MSDLSFQQNKKKHVSVSLSQDLYDKLADIAHNEDRHLSRQIRLWAVQCIQKYETAERGKAEILIRTSYPRKTTQEYCPGSVQTDASKKPGPCKILTFPIKRRGGAA